MNVLTAVLSAVPVPPYGATVSDTVETAVTTVMASLATAALVFALVYWWRTGRPGSRACASCIASAASTSRSTSVMSSARS